MAEKKNIAFLLGAGASQAVGMPGTATIDSEISNFANYARNSYGRYVRVNPEIQIAREEITNQGRIRAVFSTFQTRYAQKYLDGPGRRATYEDKYFALDQLYKSRESGNFNPILHFELSEFDRDFAEIAPETEDAPGFFNAVFGLEQALYYIRDVVWWNLSSTKLDVTPLNFICQIIRSHRGGVDVFTLNHDLTIDELFAQCKITFTDGFVATDFEISIFDESALNESNHVTVTKLHGSVNWFAGPIEVGQGRVFKDTRPHHDPLFIEKNDESKIELVLERRPLLLVGTHNKVLSYTEGIFTVLFNRFYRTLTKIDRLVVIGYSFGDKGITDYLVNWINHNEENRLIIIDPDAEELITRVFGFLGAIENNLVKVLKKSCRLVTFASKVEDIDPSNVIKSLS